MKLKDIKPIVLLALSSIFLGVVLAFILSDVVKSNNRTKKIILESRLDSAYSTGYWRGVRVMLKYYPPIHGEYRLDLITKEFKTYQEVLKEKESVDLQK